MLMRNLSARNRIHCLAGRNVDAYAHLESAEPEILVSA